MHVPLGLGKLIGVLVALGLVQYFSYSLHAFVDGYYVVYHDQLNPPDAPPPELPAWACVDKCVPSAFNESQFHCAGCFQPALSNAPPRQAVKAYELKCTTINDYYVRDTFVMRDHACRSSLLDLLLEAILDMPLYTSHPVCILHTFVFVACLAVQVWTVVWFVKINVALEKDEEAKAHEREKEVIKKTFGIFDTPTKLQMIQQQAGEDPVADRQPQLNESAYEASLRRRHQQVDASSSSGLP